MKKLEWAVLLGFVCSICIATLTKTAETCTALEQNVLRLHILANSDTIDDQALKLKVRDRLLEETAIQFQDCDSFAETLELATESLPQLEILAREVVAENGYGYGVTAELVEMDFDARTYDEITLPAGTYTALRITIGAAKGQNWWCVMYPSLCLPSAMDVTGQIEDTTFDKETKQLLENPQQFQVKLKCITWMETLIENVKKM